jgi:hypothetical protein
MSDELKAADASFEQWWEEHGQFCRAGGGAYEKTFAYRAWHAALSTQPAAPSPVVPDGMVKCRWEEIKPGLGRYVPMTDYHDPDRLAAWNAANPDTNQLAPPTPASRVPLTERPALDEAVVQLICDGHTKLADALRSESSAHLVEWFCEDHPEFAMGHDGCTGAGILPCTQIPMLVRQREWARQVAKESIAVRDDVVFACRRQLTDGATRTMQVPLTDERIETISKDFLEYIGDHWSKTRAIPDSGRVEDFARAIEAAHGIVEPARGNDEATSQMNQSVGGIAVDGGPDAPSVPSVKVANHD